MGLKHFCLGLGLRCDFRKVGGHLTIEGLCRVPYFLEFPPVGITCTYSCYAYFLCVTHGFPTHEPKSKSDSEAQSMPRQAPPSRGRTPGGNLSVGRGEGGDTHTNTQIKMIDTHICMYAWGYVGMHACMDAWMYGCMDVWMYGCMYVCIHTTWLLIL